MPLDEASGRNIRKWAVLILVPLALAAGFWFYRWKVQRAAAPVNLGETVTLEDKQKLALYLNTHVKLPDFTAEIHPLEMGENFWGVARDYGVDFDTLVGCNPELKGLGARINQPILMPSYYGALHQVVAGENVSRVAALFSASPALVRKANHIAWSGLTPGQILFIPNAKPKDFSPDMAKLYSERTFLRSPLGGRTSSQMGVRQDPFTGERRHHNGMDIRAPLHTAVGAAGEGVVEFAGVNGGYGKCVIVRHERGYKTLYGHLEKIYVKRGQKVKQHQFLGRVGMTGRTTGPHLHFTVWLNNKVQDPSKYLW